MPIGFPPGANCIGHANSAVSISLSRLFGIALCRGVLFNARTALTKRDAGGKRIVRREAR